MKEETVLTENNQLKEMDMTHCQLPVIYLSDLLIIHVPSAQKLMQPLCVKLSSIVVEKTVVITVLGSVYHSIVLALPCNTPCSEETIELLDANELDLSTQIKDTDWSFLNTLLPGQLPHLHNELTHLLQNDLAIISQQTHAALWQIFALQNTDILLLEDGRVYIHFTYPLFDCVDTFATLKLNDVACETFSIALRFIQGHVYGLSQQSVRFQDIDAAHSALFTLAHDNHLMLTLKPLRSAADGNALLSVFAPLEPAKISAAIIGLEGDVVQGYCFDELKPFKVLALDVYLNGCYQQRVLADRHTVDAKGTRLNCGWAWQLDQTYLQGDRYDIDLVCVETQQRLSGSPYRLGCDSFDASFQITDGRCLYGQLNARSIRQVFPVFQLAIDGVTISVECLPIASQLQQGLPCWQVEIPLPPLVNDGSPHQLSIQFSTDKVSSSPILVNYQAHYVGVLERVDNELVSGWIYQKQAPTKPVNLDLLINGEQVATLSANSWPKVSVKVSANSAPLACGFYFRLGATTAYETCRVLSLNLAGTNAAVLAPPILFTPYDTVISTLIDAQASLLKRHDHGLANGIQVPAHASQWVRQQILAPIIKALRTEQRIPRQLTLDLTEALRLPPQRLTDPVVDIILPVFKGLKETLICIRSVLELTEGAYHLIVINDASPDIVMTKMLQAWATAEAFTLLENPNNLGFVATVNHGMRQHPQRDVVLLNADTVVTQGWLTRLQAAALSAANIATATPFSNNASLVSFPLGFEENPMPEVSALAELAQQCATVNDGVVMNMPTAVGFCMYIKREALNDVGDFDESRFGKGYAEENDFCLRASALGWRHVVACDAFVAHHGATSFEDEKTALMSKNLQQLNARYPDYAMTIERFTVQNSLSQVRNRLSIAALKAYAQGYLLFITHDLGGGTKKHVDDLAQRLQKNTLATLALTHDARGQWQLTAYGQAYRLSYQGNNAFEELLSDLKQLGVWHVHIHHVLHFPKAIWTVPERLGVQYDVTLHDYYTVCPSINMIDESKHYCGDNQLDTAACDRCLRINPLNEAHPGFGLVQQLEVLGGTMAAWRAFYGAKLSAARHVFAPSQATATLVLSHYSLENIQVRPHPEEVVMCAVPKYQSEAHYRIAVIGAIGEHKGYSLLLNCAKAALKKGLPLEFIVFGYTLDDSRLASLSNIHLAGRYTQDELPQHLATWQCQVAAFLSVWPETFSYTLSEAWRAGLYPVAFDLGALAERIRQSGYGRILPLTHEASIINTALLEAVLQVNAMTPTEQRFGHEYADILNDYYQLELAAPAPLSEECHAHV